MNDPKVSRPGEPQSVVCLKVDTLGDLVLFAPAIAALRSSWPDANISVVIRDSYLDLAELLVHGIEWITTSINPFSQGPAECRGEFDRLRSIVADKKPVVLVAATSQRNWLEIAIAASATASRRLALGAAVEDEFFATQLRLGLGIDAKSAFTDYVCASMEEPDWQRNFRLVDALTGAQIPRTTPSLALTAAVRALAAPILEQYQLRRGHFAVCAPAGFANVTIKTWPADRFAAAVRHLHEHHGLPTLLIGNESEREHLALVAEQAGVGARTWIGREHSLPELAALIAEASVFLGNDTGAMHIAAALDIPTVGVFGGGTWPRFVPAARHAIAVVQPLPCFGCGWDCAFGDAPCIGGIGIQDVTRALDELLAMAAIRGDAAQRAVPQFSKIQNVDHLSTGAKVVMDKAATRYRELRREHLARQHKLEELTVLARAKDAAILEKEAEIFQKQDEIGTLKQVCNEREKILVELDRHVRRVNEEIARIAADNALLQKTLRELPADSAAAGRAIADQAVHIRNIEALVTLRERELAELRASAANRDAGLHDLEQAKHYGRLLAEKEAVIRTLSRACHNHEAVIKQLMAEATAVGAKMRKLWIAAQAFCREKWWRPFDAWLFGTVVERYWMQIGVLRHYAPKPLKWDERLPAPGLADAKLPQVGIVTPSYGQEKFIERTMRSILDQHFPKLRYVVQDGGSKDRSPEIIARYGERLQHWASKKDNGQADAIVRGFTHIVASLDPDDVMAWLNSDDLLGPGVLRFVAEYFVRHPEVDVIYGHRIIIDDDDRDVGRWIMPPHHPATLEWVDYVPQETLFWRKRAWDLVGGIDPTFQFALDWDILARFHQAGCKIVRVPYFLGAFRVHYEQKTSQAIHTVGAEEMRRIRTRFHGENQDDFETIERFARHTRFWGAVTARLHEIGIRW